MLRGKVDLVLNGAGCWVFTIHYPPFLLADMMLIDQSLAIILSNEGRPSDETPYRAVIHVRRALGPP